MKDSTKKAQIKRFYECLKDRPMTTKMAAEKLGIQRCNLTRYVAYLEKRNLITVVQGNNKAPGQILFNRSNVFPAGNPIRAIRTPN